MPLSQPGSEETMPPGSSILIADETAFVLVPTPTSDPNDPLNWSFARKAMNVGLMYAITVAVFTAIIVQSVFWPQMTVELNMSFAQLNAGLACNVAGLAAGSLLVIPFTLKYGRRPTYILSTAIMAAISWWSSRLQTLTEMYITNLLFGLGASVNETIAQLTVADLFFVHQRGRVNGLYVVCTVLGNTLIPTLAGLQAAAQGWRHSYYTLGIVLTVLTIIFVFLFEETSYVPHDVGENVDQNGATSNENTSIGPEDGFDTTDVKTEEPYVERTDPTEQSPRAMNSYRQRMRFVSPDARVSLLYCFLAPWKMAMMAHVMFTGIQAANLVAWLVMISSINPIIMSAPPYNFGSAGVGLMLVGPFVGTVLGSLFGGVLGDWLVVRLAKRNKGIFEPEFRLYILPLPVLLTGAGLIVYGWSLSQGAHRIYPAIGSGMFSFGMGCILDMSFTMVIDTYKDAVAESFIFVTFVRNAIPLGLPFGVVPWLNSMTLTHVGIISGSICTAIGLLFVPLMIWGKKLRIGSTERYRKVKYSSPVE